MGNRKAEPSEYLYKGSVTSGSVSHLFAGSTKSVIVENRDRSVSTIRVGAPKRSWLWQKHEAGTARLGIAPVRSNGTCLWGALDLDAHEDGDRDRLRDAQAVAAGFQTLEMTPYIARSRGGRGYHVFVLFDEPGVRAEDLRVILNAFADKVRPADVFPSGDRCIFMPCYGGAPLFDADMDIVDTSKVEPDDPGLVATAIGGTTHRRHEWPPRSWAKSKRYTSVSSFDDLADVHHLLFGGHGGMINARDGARNKIAGMTARTILKRGGTYADFLAWDSNNQPPLSSTDPKLFKNWWKWAENKSRR